jgi:hypothetical protein
MELSDETKRELLLCAMCGAELTGKRLTPFISAATGARVA